MQLNLGVKDLEEIENLIDTDCWKAFFWIHSIILLQLKYLFYYSKQVKRLGAEKIDLILNEQGSASKTIELKNVDEHKEKWKKVQERLWNMHNTIELCYARSLIDEEYSDLIDFNEFRNEIGHPKIYTPLPSDSVVKDWCRVGLKIIKSLDTKIVNSLFENS